MSINTTNLFGLRALSIAGGTYGWQTCIRPGSHRYYVYSYLSRPGYATAIVAMDTLWFSNQNGYSWAIWGSGLKERVGY